MMDVKLALISALILVAGTYGITRWTVKPEVAYTAAYEQRVIDSLTVARRATVLRTSAIIDSLEGVNAALANEVGRSNTEIAGYTRILGVLNTERDSLEQVARLRADELAEISAALRLENEAVSVPIVDTLLVSSATFGDGLLRSTAVLGTDGVDLLLPSPAITLLRDVRLDVVTTVEKNNAGVHVFVTSEDFTGLRVEHFTALTPSRRRLPWFWIGAGAGLVGGLVLSFE